MGEDLGGLARYEPHQVPRGERRQLLNLVRPGARVLDVGCWTGFNGRYLARRDCELYGVELSPAAASHAADYTWVGVGDISTPEMQNAVSRRGPYEVILLLDVLEHLPNPASVLSELVQNLVGAGLVLTSIPNVAYWGVRKALLLGRWDYRESGILDSSHLRFFTQETARELLCGAGLMITFETVSPGRLPLVPHAPRLEQLASQLRPSVFGAQFLFGAQVSGARRGVVNGRRNQE
jgi:SAM-dependent methyltransferase